MDFKLLANLRRHLHIKHHIPGRIRIGFKQALASEPQVKKLANSGAAIPPGVHNVRFNALARSVVIEYDAGRIPADMLEELLHTKDDDRAAGLLRELDALLQPPEKKEVN